MELPVLVDALVAASLLLLTIGATLWSDVAMIVWLVDAGRRGRHGWIVGLALLTPCWVLATGAWMVSTTTWLARNVGELV